jgi:hypothetical protein
VFKRPHHQRIAHLLHALDGTVLRSHTCLFGGGTAIALKFGEYRESVDMDFMVSEITHYRTLRQMLTGTDGVQPLFQKALSPVKQLREVRADQYGIRTLLTVDEQPIKFEIILEARIKLMPCKIEDDVCGVPSLSMLDMATCKLLANSDRWNDDSVFSRDVIDLAMMKPSHQLLKEAIEKAQGAYGDAIQNDLKKAISRLKTRESWLDRCMTAMNMTAPKALIWQNLKNIQIDI